MITNFEHMKKWPVIYRKLLWIEDQMLDGAKEVTKKTEEEFDLRIESCKAVIGFARTALEMLLGELFKAAHVSDEDVVRVLNKVFPENKENRANLFGRIKLLEEYKLVSPECTKDMHFLRKIGNKGLHTGNPEERYKQELETAKKVYECLYRLSYLFANQYMPQFTEIGEKMGNRNSSAKGGNTANNTAKAGNTASGLIWSVLLAIGCILLVGLMAVTTMY